MDDNSRVASPTKRGRPSVKAAPGVFKVLGVGWELPPKFSRIFYLGGNSPCPILFSGSVWCATKYSF